MDAKTESQAAHSPNARIKLESALPQASPNGPLLLSMSLLILFVAAAVLPWWNRYIAVTNDAWHYFYGQQILAGKMPYKDFYLFIPPLYALKNLSLIALFGNHLIVPHLAAIAEIMILAVVLIAWISRVFPLLESAVGVTTALALFIFCMDGETLGGLHQEAIFFPVLAGWAASYALPSRAAAPFLLAGLFAGLSLLAKQTSGVATVACLGLLILALRWRRDGKLKAIAAFAMFLAAVAVPLAIVCTWLAAKGALAPFLDDAFVKGTSSKGPLLHVVLRPLIMAAQDLGFRVCVLLTIGCLGAFFWLVRRSPLAEGQTAPGGRLRLQLLLFFLASLAALASGAILSRLFSPPHPHTFLWLVPKDFLIFSGEIGCLILFLLSARAFCRPHFTQRQSQLLLLSGFGAGLGYALGCSWVDYVPIVLPSLAVLLAYVLDRLTGTRRLRMLRMAVILACLLFITQVCMFRMNHPFAWGGWQEPNVRSATHRFAEPELAGFLGSSESTHIVDRITQDIVANSQPRDSIFTYPNLSIFYVLAHRSPATRAYVHYIDVAPDFIDREDAANLLRNPPAVIVYWEQTEAEVTAAEFYFRNGKRSGLRDLITAIEILKPHYRILDTFQSRTGDKFVVMTNAPNLSATRK